MTDNKRYDYDRSNSAEGMAVLYPTQLKIGTMLASCGLASHNSLMRLPAC